MGSALMDIKNLKVPEFQPPLIEPPRTLSQKVAAYSPQVKAALIGAAVTIILAVISLWFQHSSYSRENGRLKQEIADLVRQRDIADAKAHEDENALAPWKMLALSKYPNEPVAEGLRNVLKLLGHEMPSLPHIAISTLEGLPPEKTNNPYLKEYELLLRNTSDVELNNLCSRIQLPEPIVETPEPPEKFIGTQLDCKPTIKSNVLVKGTGGRGWVGGASAVYPQYVEPCFWPDSNRGLKGSLMSADTATGIWELQVDKIPPKGYVRVRFITSTAPEVTNYVTFANTPLWSSPPNPQTVEDTNELRFHFEGQYQFQSEVKPGTQRFFVPLIYDQKTRNLSSLPATSDVGHWHAITMRYE
jgi:hypothetical protein